MAKPKLTAAEREAQRKKIEAERAQRKADKAKEKADKAEAAKPVLSEADQTLLTDITAAMKVEDGARENLITRGVELGKLLIEAFHRYPTRRTFLDFLKPIGMTIGRAIDPIRAAGGREVADVLQLKLDDDATPTQKSRDKKKLESGVTSPDVTPEPVRTPNGEKIDPSQLGPKVQEQLRAIGNGELTDQQAKDRMAALDYAGDAPATVPEEIEGLAPVELTAEERTAKQSAKDYEWVIGVLEVAFPRMLEKDRAGVRKWSSAWKAPKVKEAT